METNRKDLRRWVAQWLAEQPPELRSRLRGEEIPEDGLLAQATILFAALDRIEAKLVAFRDGVKGLSTQQKSPFTAVVTDAKKQRETVGKARVSLAEGDKRAEIRKDLEDVQTGIQGTVVSKFAELGRILRSADKSQNPQIDRLISEYDQLTKDFSLQVKLAGEAAERSSTAKTVAEKKGELDKSIETLESLAEALRKSGDIAGAERVDKLAADARATLQRLEREDPSVGTGNGTITLDSFGEDYRNQINESLARQTLTIEDENKYKMRTQASLVFVPNLKAVQPALIQSFSARNFIQALWPNIDPTDVRRQVRTDLVEQLSFEMDGNALPGGKYDLSRLDKPLRDDLVEFLTQERLSKNYLWTRSDIVSLDFGLTGIPLGDRSDTHERRVDDSFPQFLFGGGLHFWRLEASAGAMLFRDNNDDFEEEFYFGISIDLFNSALGPSASSVARAPDRQPSLPTGGASPAGVGD